MLCVCVCVCVVYYGDMWNEEVVFAHVLTHPHSPSLVFMGLVSTGLPFNLRYRHKIQCVVLPAHSKWTVYERISNLHKVLNQISGCPWNKYCTTSWDIHWERLRVCSKMHTWILHQAATYIGVSYCAVPLLNKIFMLLTNYSLNLWRNVNLHL